MTGRPVVAVSSARGPVRDSARVHFVQWASEVLLSAVASARGTPMIVPFCRAERQAAAVLAVADALVLTGGHDVTARGQPHRPHYSDPGRDDSDMRLLAAARARGIPILGICRGMQLLVVSCGGNLTAVTGHASPDGASVHKHSVEVEPGTLLRDIAGLPRVTVNTLHRYAVDAPGEHRIVGWGPDRVAEAVEHPNRWELGVQWHPEYDKCAASARLWPALVREASRHRVGAPRYLDRQEGR